MLEEKWASGSGKIKDTIGFRIKSGRHEETGSSDPVHELHDAGGLKRRECEEQKEGCISIDIASLGIPRNARTFALKVRGESMIDAHICDGDTVILEFREPRHLDIVAALIDGETTLKRFVMENGRPFLHAENTNFPDIIPARELVVQGVLVGLLRTGRL